MKLLPAISQQATGDELLTIGEAAERTDLTRKAIRLYEQRGLLPAARRSDGGYRLYSADDLDVLAFIRRARALDLHLEEIGDILDLQRGGQQPCGQVLAVVDDHLAEIDRTIADLKALRRSLRSARDVAKAGQRDGQRAVVCQIIEHEPASPRPDRH